MKKKSLAAAFLAAIVSCLLFGCGNGTVKNSESAESAPVNALLKAGAYRGTLSLNAELGLRLDAEDLSAGYAELVDPDGQSGVPVITRQMELSVAEDLRTGRFWLPGSVVFRDALGESTAETEFAGTGTSFSLFEDGNWGSAVSGNAFLGFFADAFAALSVEGGQKASSDMEGQEAFSSMEGCFLCETELKGNDALVKELAGLADVSADVSIPVRLWVLESSGLPVRLEADVRGLGDALLTEAFAGSWVDGTWFTLKSCRLTFNWTDFGGANDFPDGTESSSPDDSIPDSLLPALLHVGSAGLLERRNENLAMLEQILSESVPDESVPEDDRDFLPEDDVEELPEPEDESWIQEVENPGEITLIFSNVGTVAMKIPEGYQLLGHDGSSAVVASTDGGGRERIADYYLEYANSPEQVEKDVCAPEGFSAALGFRDVEMGEAREITVNGMNFRWRGAVYVQDNGDGTETCFRDVHVWRALGGGVFRVQISVPCAGLEEARSLEPENLVWEFLGLVHSVQ